MLLRRLMVKWHTISGSLDSISGDAVDDGAMNLLGIIYMVLPRFIDGSYWLWSYDVSRSKNGAFID